MKSLLKPLSQRRYTALSALFGVIASLALLSASLLFNTATIAGAKNLAFYVPLLDAHSAIAMENQKSGTTAWELPSTIDSNFIQGYADQASVEPGQPLTLFVSTMKPATYNLDIYRMGWYHGTGGRLYYSAHGLPAQAQGYYLYPSIHDCPTCVINPKTHRVEANWHPSFILPVGATWLSGVYLIKLTVGSTAGSYIVFVVRNDQSTSVVLANVPVNTYQAYNQWGGYSLYKAVTPLGSGPHAVWRANEVSYDRPYLTGRGAGDFLLWDVLIVHWMERSGLDVTYTTSVDTTARPATILRHRIYIAMGHDEYWSLKTRDALEAARNQGISLAFLGGNDSYWQVRLEPDSQGHPYRTEVCYKVIDGQISPTVDPLYKTHPELLTARWADPLLHRPQNELLGLMYEGDFTAVTKINGKVTAYYPDWVAAQNSMPPLLRGTGLAPGEHISGGLLGYEFDGISNNGLTPPDLQVISSSWVKCYGKWLVANSAYYYAPSGALVFDAGSIWWSYGLDGFTGLPHSGGIYGNQAIVNFMANLIRAMYAASVTSSTLALITANPAPTPLSALFTSFPQPASLPNSPPQD